MRVAYARASSALAAAFLITSSASAVTMDWTFIGYPGNPADTEVMTWDSTGAGRGSVPYDYRIGTYEVTNAQYTEFLNAKVASDPLGDYLALYNPAMGSSITQSGVPGSYTFSTIAGRENMPVVGVSFFDAMRFANWMNNGQGSASTEMGAYTLLFFGGFNGFTSNYRTVTRNPGAEIFIPTENEWYKAAYYDPSTTSYFDYATGSNTPPTCTTPTATPNSANCGNAVGGLTPVGSYTGSASPYGIFDLVGNTAEWVEKIYTNGDYRGYRSDSSFYEAWDDYFTSPLAGIGFRLAMVPEPSTGLLTAFGLLGLAVRRRIRD